MCSSSQKDEHETTPSPKICSKAGRWTPSLADLCQRVAPHVWKTADFENNLADRYYADQKKWVWIKASSNSKQYWCTVSMSRWQEDNEPLRPSRWVVLGDFVTLSTKHSFMHSKICNKLIIFLWYPILDKFYYNFKFFALRTIGT
jgi:hypothetical protein